MAEPRISFKPLEENDFELLHRWLNTPHVSRWWGMEDDSRNPSLERVREHWIKRIVETEPVSCYIIQLDSRPAGYVQWYMADDFPESSEMVPAPNRTAGVDIFIGEPSLLYKGIGPVIIREFLNAYIFRESSVETCIIDPEPENRAAIRAYEKAGFKYSHTVFNSKDNVYAYVMILNRKDFYATMPYNS